MNSANKKGRPRKELPSPIKKRQEERVRMPEKIEAVIPESHLYTQLLEFERTLDAKITQRRINMKESIRATPSKTAKILRLTARNFHHNQTGTYHTDSNLTGRLEEEPSWTFRIEGRLVDEQTKQPLPAMTQPKRLFSSFFRKILIMLDKEDYPEDNMIEWVNTNSGDFDGFDLRRRGSKETTIKVYLWPDHRPTQYRISPLLAKVVNASVDTRLKVITALWAYIKANKLYGEDRKTVNLNPILKEIFRVDKILFSQIPQLITEHLSPLDPLEFTYVIRLNTDTHEQNYDIQLLVEDPIVAMPDVNVQKEIDATNSQILKHIEDIHQHKRKRDFYLGFIASPVEFINNVVETQIRDYKLMTSDVSRDEEEERHSKYFYQPFVPDAVQLYLSSASTTFD
eukprot:TRINITY_DN5590_c0_g1_i1.p1 TRINITY_DN5590_c0_g1~~TRINITY_DN5590_c0_g1_i1.p1  ORF type:complete len:398 (-),score=68.24 TRINITY_DN5590_c0_g1_i1:3-1196(-)